MTDQNCCPYCSPPVVIKSRDSYCHNCGRLLARIKWCFSAQPVPPASQTWRESIRDTRSGGAIIPSAEGFVYFCVRNSGSRPVKVKIKLVGDNPALVGSNTVAVNGGEVFDFKLRCTDQEIDATLHVETEDGPRTEWWERKSVRSSTIKLEREIDARQEKWIMGSPHIVFPPGTRSQHLFVWNRSVNPRKFSSGQPYGYEVRFAGDTIETPVPFGPEKSRKLTIEAVKKGPDLKRDREWAIDIDALPPVPLHHLETEANETGPAVIIGIDFGTRNTSMRVLWRHSGRLAKPRGTIDPVGDHTGAKRFPTEMVLNRKGERELIGSDAADYIQNNRLTADEIGVQNLKTLLRTGEMPYDRHTKRNSDNPDWAPDRLLKLYFKRLFRLLENYFDSAVPNTVLKSRLYVVTRPVLDHQGSEGTRYEEALRSAILACDPNAEIVFELEPVAAAKAIAFTHRSELLKLNGQAIAIVDAGGGTTDIVLARVGVENERIVLNPIRAYDFTISADNPAQEALKKFGELDRHHFGGNVLDYALAFQLRSDAKKILDFEGVEPPAKVEQSNDREFPELCRQLKETCTIPNTRPYLNKKQGSNAEQDKYPFPTVDEYDGVYLAHDQYGENVLKPILEPATAMIRRQIGEQEMKLSDNILPMDVQHVFCVGGANADGFVRGWLSTIFPNRERRQSLDNTFSIEERMNAVIEGAVRSQEQMFVSSPLTLTVLCNGKRTEILSQGKPVPESEVYFPFSIGPLSDNEYLAQLLASEGGLEDEICVAQGYYNSEVEQDKEFVLTVSVGRKSGVRAVLELEGRPDEEQWSFIFLEEQVNVPLKTVGGTS